MVPPVQPRLPRYPAPCAPLRPFVEAYGVRDVEFGTRQVCVPLPGRRDCFLEFYLRGRYRVVTVATGAEHWAPLCVLVGPSTHRQEDLKLSGSLQVFSIRFSPTGFRALFKIPASLLRDRAIEASLVLGPEIGKVHEKLAEAGPAEWPRIADRYLLTRLAQLSLSPESRIARQAATAMQRTHGRIGVSAIAAQATVSPRHLERVFQEQVGVSPKMFGKLVRLARALELAGAGSSWAGVAHACGFFDQSHMVRDFRALTGVTPVEFAALRSGALPIAPPETGSAHTVPLRSGPPPAG